MGGQLTMFKSKAKKGKMMQNKLEEDIIEESRRTNEEVQIFSHHTCYSILAENANGWLGRPKKKWFQAEREDLRGGQVENYTELARNRKYWNKLKPRA